MPQRLLGGYGAREGRYDELLSAGGVPRAHWEPLLGALASRERDNIGDTLAQIEREIRENGITYNVYADPKGADRPWEVDPLPLALPAAEWAGIAAGIAQRADLLNRVLADLYGEQSLLKSGAIPPAVVFGHRGFLPPVQAIRPPGGVHLFHYAADLARSPDGRWWVVSDRTQAPSGAGYALENRLVVARVFPKQFREMHVQRLATFFAAMRVALRDWAPRSGPGGGGPPLIVLLTPGPYNETYFEHALLARYLGFALVEGSDLTVRDGCVWMKTVEGLQRVHAILRRQDDDYCDPLELRTDSALGVAGLTDCARRGSVMIANALGSGVLESGALLGYLPRLAERLLGESLKLPSVATWWLGEPAAFADAWKHLDRLIIKPLERSVREPALFGIDLDAPERAALRERVAARPQRYVAQEWVHVSEAPVLEHGRATRIAARTVGLRVFAVATPSGWHVMPGGLTRVAADGESRVIAMQRGGRSKDTWVLGDAPVEATFSLLTRTVGPDQLVGARANLPSRAAENLYWFGRYGERCDNAARLLRVANRELLDHVDERPDDLAPTLVLAARYGLVDEIDDPVAALMHAATHAEGALAEHLRRLSRVAFNLRDRMSTDHWRSLNRLIGDPVFRREGAAPIRPAQALTWLDRAVTSLMTLSGFVLDGMNRGTGWRFLSLGRRIERLANQCTALEVAMHEGRTQGLDWLLDHADSTVTYRSRYLVAPEWMPVLDLLVRDEANPRSLAFQAKGIAEYVAKLEVTHGRVASDVIVPAQAALQALRAADLDPDSAALAEVVEGLHRAARQVSDELSLKFFSHAASRSVLSLVA